MDEEKRAAQAASQAQSPQAPGPQPEVPGVSPAETAAPNSPAETSGAEDGAAAPAPETACAGNGPDGPSAQTSPGETQPDKAPSAETAAPKDGTSEAETPEAGASGTETSEAGASEAGTSEAETPETGTPEAGASEAGTPEAGASEAGTPEAGTPEAGTPEAGASGTETSEAGASEAGTPEDEAAEPSPAQPSRSVAEQLSAAGLPQPPPRRPQDPPGEPGEVVEYYYQPTFGREVVECYVQPGTLPGRRSARSAPPKRRRRTGLWIFLAVLAVLVAAVIAAAVWRANTPPSPPADGSQQETPDWEEPDSSATVSIPTYKADAGVQLTIADSHGAALTAQQVYERVNPAVVSVIVQLKEGASIGTGILFTQDGYLLTNYHVVAGGTDCSVALNNDRQYTARYVAGDSKNDIAILKVEGSHLPTAEFGSSDALEVGDTVYAIGNPLGVELRGTFTNGIVSAINRDVKVDDRTMTLIQTNAALNSGNSGGPLINCYGQVVGINTIKMSSAFSTVEGLGFAIPSVSVASLADDLLTTGSVLSHETRLGISVSSFGIQLQDGTWGVEVLEVSTPSPAADAGIRKGDVIVSAGGQSVSSSRELLNVRRQYRAGQSLPVKVWRSGEYLNFSLKLAEAAS